MNKQSTLNLAREIFKIRISSANEGDEQDDEVHKMKIRGIKSYDPSVIEKWYLEAIKTAEIIINLEEQYLTAPS
ncbi:MAG: hypothetical protein P4L74_04375 [Candidatus Doudnabacteria bacterium]|nr:hypothetical protein [Candidatus Doudnabacteria bacterium]